MERWPLPEGWEWRTLETLVSIKYGRALKKEEREEHGTFCVYGSNGVVGHHTVPLTHGPTIIIGRKGSAGAVHFSIEPCWPIDTTFYVDDFPSFVFPAYLSYFLGYQKLEQLNIHAAIPGLRREDLERILIPLPYPDDPARSLETQRRIVARLDALLAEVAAARRLHAEIMADTARVMEAVVQEVFGDVDRENWYLHTLGELVDNYDHMRIPVRKADREKMRGEYPYYGATGIIDFVDSFLFDGEYLLISEDGANLIARKYPIAFIATGKFWVNNHAHVLKAKPITSNQYLAYAIAATDISHLVTGAAQPKLNQTRMNQIPIWLPKERSAQDRIVAYLNGVQEQIKEILQSQASDSELLTELEQAILAQAFRGEL